ncbi:MULTISPECIES: recombinase family protein [Dysgonomonas]|uniref:recombinase family protein n=1 Tax=Dysgonomonas TaxID=156973 RepID=UPI00208EAA7A|nr:recombinase family protein [Dysgonomonas mossii]
MSNNTTARKTSFGIPEQKGNVTIYPAVPIEILKTRGHKMRAAAYVRVSTDSVGQEGSLMLQREYYENYIKGNPEYVFIAIYEDDGITATSVEKRKGFLRMIEDCRLGKIDIILTKSISRFARNLGDLLYYINMLNSLESPVEVYFEADRISTFGTSGEMLITFLGLFAQEESRLKSEAITWAVDNLFAQGKYYAFPVLGYNKEKGRDSPLTINKEEAKTVRLCYALAIMGYSFSDIAKTMNILGLKSRLGNVHWTVSGVRALLSNEKYAGAIRARKTITRSYKTHKSKKNEGEKPQYYHKEHHEAIVPPEAYDVALRIIKNRRGKNGIPYLKAVSEGILKGFVVVSKNVRGYTLNDYVKASHSIYEEDDDPKINILADKASIFDLRTYDIVSTFSFDDRTKPACSIKDGKIIFNVACKKALRAEKAEMLFHPLKAILALRLSVSEVFSERINDICIIKPVHHSHFTSIALESAGLKSGYRYRIYGAKRTRENESIMLFDLRNAEIIPPKKDIYILPDKYTSRYGDDYYENIAACGLYKIDIEGLWQALHESKPIDSLAGQIVELTEFCQKSLAEFELSEEINHE